LEVSRAYGLERLRGEFEKLFATQGISPVLLGNDRNWRIFISHILADLDDREIYFSDDVEHNTKAKGRAYYLRMKQRRVQSGEPADVVTTRTFFLNRIQSPPEPGRPAGIYWRVVLKEHAGVPIIELNGLLRRIDATNV
jgi:hypothetical protein